MAGGVDKETAEKICRQYGAKLVARPSVDLKAYFKDRDCEEHKRGYWLSGDAEALGGQCKLWTPGLSDDLPEVRYLYCLQGV